MSVSTEANPRLAALTAAGTSVWLDQIRRSLIENGELQRLIDEDSLRGVTANPAIFEKAILGSDDYDADIRAMAREGLDPKAMYERIAVTDVQMAADVMRPVWEHNDHDDGFVSLEVDPDLAHDTDGTLEQVRAFWKRLDRPNVFIKIPGTEEGAPAIEQAIYEGINVNVTLLFAVAAYERVAEAYIRGLERRLDEGESVDIRSVASFFVSRVDTEVDKRLEASGNTELQGTAAVANARAAYQRFKEIFLGERFNRLREAGARVQRPLWASTGVKNPHYSETKYVDDLVAPHTVNTMPMQTLLAAAERSEISGPTADEDPSEELDALAGAGIDLDDVTAKLLRDGVKAFETSLDGLLAGIEEQREGVIIGRPPTIRSAIPSELEAPIAETGKRATAESVAKRVWRKDDTLWGAHGAPEIADRLGWLTISEPMLEHAAELHAFVAECQSEGFEHCVLCGMGGSSLGPEVIRRTFGDIEGAMRLQVLDSTDPAAVLAVQQSVDLAKTLFVISSKSGGTIETLSHYRYFRAQVEAAVGDADAGRHFAAVTDPGSPLGTLAHSNGFRHVFAHDPDIGRRYSVLSYFGLVPAAAMGVAIGAPLHRCQVAEQNCTRSGQGTSNTGPWAAIVLGALANAGRDKLTFIVSEPISSFGLWVEQLVAESTGKQGKGVLPVADEPIGPPEAYGNDRLFAYLRNADEPDEELDAKVEALADAGQPVLTLSVHGATDLGRIFFFAEFAVAVAGWAMGINPFHQPTVQAAQDSTDK